jgi:hypothetical protein
MIHCLPLLHVSRLDPILNRAERAHRPDNLAEAARTELGVFDGLLHAELRRIILTEAEASALAALYSTFDASAIGMLLYAEAADGFRLARGKDPTGGDMSSFATQFSINEEVLLAKLLECGPTADLALRDALSRWWQTTANDNPDPDDRTKSFRAVGIHIIDRPA